MFLLEHALNQPVFKYWRNIFDLTHLISGNLWKSLHNNVRKWVQFKWSVSIFKFDVVFDSYIFLLKIYDPLICHIWSLIWLHTHCYFTRLNLNKMEPLQFCLSISLGILRNPKQKEFFNSYEGFLMAALTGSAIPAHSKKLPKWHFLTPAWNFGEPNASIWRAMKVPFCDFIQYLSQAPLT